MSAYGKPEYLADDTVDSVLDERIRGLLTTCFTKPEDVVFKERRYFREPYRHRWVIKDERGTLIAHVGVHEKTVEADGKPYRIAGMAEVCVHPDCRGRGYVKSMLRCIHSWLAPRGFVFSALFGDPKIYSSSGYVSVSNLFHDVTAKDGRVFREQCPVMVKELTETPWPGTAVYLPGLKF